MKLKYRGVSYEYGSPVLDMTESQVVGKYRGLNWDVRYPRHMNIPQPVMELKYRGVSYQTTPTGEIEVPTATHDLRSLEKELASVHQTHLLKRLAHRLEVAKAKGDPQLVRLLELESRQLA